MTRPIGLLAGGGRFPIVVAEKARKLGQPIVTIGISGEASPELEGLSTRFYWAGVAKLGRWIRCFKREGVEQFMMAGKVHKTRMYSRFSFLRYLPDWRCIWVFYLHLRRDNRDDSLLLTAIDEFAKDGITCASALELCPELLVKKGCLTKRKPTNMEMLDIDFGWEMAKEMGRLDVGQSVVVKQRSVIAVEAVEGTDRAILRAGELCPAGGFTVVKVAKPQQDMRFDVPTVGETTVQNIHKAGGKLLAVEADKTIIIDEEKTIALADRLGICILAR